jgi:hypothetical protein
MWEVHRQLSAILQQLPDTTAPTTLAALLSQPVLQQPPHALPSCAIQLVEEAATSPFAAFVRARMRRVDTNLLLMRCCVSRLRIWSLTQNRCRLQFCDLLVSKKGKDADRKENLG